MNCSVKNDMDNMRQTTKKMKKTTDKMSESTDKIQELTEEMFHGAREFISLTNGDVTLNSVLESEGVSKKIVKASYFFAGMEFQLWTGKNKDTAEFREELIKKDVTTFFWLIDDMVKDDYDIQTPSVSKFWGTEKYDNWINLSVLAAAMSKVNNKQIKATATVYPILSFYDIIVESLKAKKDYEAGLEVPSYVEEVLAYEDVAIYLLQLRHNFLPFILASKMSNFEDSMLDSLYKIYFEWEADPSSFNKAEHKKFLSIIDRCITTRVDLEAIGVELQYNEDIVSLFQNLTWVIADNTPFKDLIQLLGMNPEYDEKEKFRFKLAFEPKVQTDAEKLVISLNKLTESTLFVYNRNAAIKRNEEAMMQEIEAIEQQFREKQLRLKEINRPPYKDHKK